MTDINVFLQDANQYAKEHDHTKVTSAEYTPPKAGKTVARLVEYIELGTHDGTYQGKPTKPRAKVVLTFDLLGKDHVTEGDPLVCNRISREYTLSTDAKASFGKVFKAMRYGRDSITNMAQLLGQAFVIDVVHTTSPKDGKVYANIDSVGAPLMADPLTGQTTPLNIRPAISPLRMFLWGAPTKYQWDSLFIDGSYNRTNADGTETVVSKNRYQEKIRASLGFVGSGIQQLLQGADALPVNPQDLVGSDDFADEIPEQFGGPIQPTVTATVTAEPQQNVQHADPLAALGLV